MYQNSPTAMLDSNIFPGTIPRTPVLGERKICFCSPKMHHNSPIQQRRIQQFSGVNIPDLRFRGERKFVFIFRKCAKTLLQQCRIQKFSRGQYSRPPFQGRGKFVLVLQNVPKLSYSNAEFKKFP